MTKLVWSAKKPDRLLAPASTDVVGLEMALENDASLLSLHLV